MVVGYNFSIRDPCARGSQRKFSLAIISDDDSYDRTQKYDGTNVYDLLANLNQISTFCETITEGIKSVYNQDNGSTKVCSTLPLKLDDVRKEEVGEELSSLCSYPKINYVNLHTQFSLYLLDVLKQKVSYIISETQFV